ncbi:MAG: ABC transporter permease [Bacteroidales bacterium]|nr:ABC transporter permease [Bacteroidales bacterium]
MYFFRKKKETNLSPGKIVWVKFQKNPTAMVALIWIGLSVLTALLGYLVTPDSTPFANDQNLELTTKSPGTRVTFLKVRKNTEPVKQNFFRTMLFGTPTSYETIPIENYRRENNTLIVNHYTGFEDFEGMELSFQPEQVLFPVDSSKILKDTIHVFFRDRKIAAITHSDAWKMIEEEHIYTQTYWLGTDRYGRDLLSQIIIGARVSLSVGFIAISIALVLGILLGSLAGFFRGKVDNFIMWLINVVWSIPTLLLVIAITFALGKGFWQVFIAVGLTMWVDVARVVRGQIISLRENEFVEAARALGLPDFRIITRHILPNITGPVVVISAANFASAILIEAGLSFLGIGVQPPMPSWGTMIRENYGYIILDKAFLAVIPGICIMMLVMAFMLVGNGLRDAIEKSPANY